MKVLTRAALLITTAWIASLACIAYARWPDLRIAKLNEIGDTLAGAFSPLAFMWLVVGYFQQGEELKRSTEALNIQARELNLSVQQQTEMARVSREELALAERSLQVAIAQEARAVAPQ